MCRHTGAGHSCHRFRLHDRRASSTFSGPVRRSWVAGIVSFHSQLRGLWSGLINWLPQKARITKPSSGIEPASTIPNHGIALTIELPGHGCRPSPGGGIQARSGKQDGGERSGPPQPRTGQRPLPTGHTDAKNAPFPQPLNAG